MVDQAEHRKKADAMFVQIATKLGLISPRSVQEALAVQARTDPPRPLGMILMEMKALSSADLEKILAAQKELAARANEQAKEARSDHLFGKVAIRMKFCTEDQLIECLEIQEGQPKGRKNRLGDIMVSRGVLTAIQVRKILDTQRGLILYCPSCDTEYNTVMFKPGASLQCYRCGSPMRIPVRSTDAPADVTHENE